MEKLNQRHNLSKLIWMIVIMNVLLLLNFYRYKKNQIIELQDHLAGYCIVLPVFGFNSAKSDLNSIKFYSLPLPPNERDIEPTVFEKANQVICFKFGDIQLLVIKNFLGGATSLDSFMKAYKTSVPKRFSDYKWFGPAEKSRK